jgi:hypothetical protein
MSESLHLQPQAALGAKCNPYHRPALGQGKAYAPRSESNQLLLLFGQ